MQFWAPPFKRDVKVFQCVQRRTRKLVKELEGMCCGEQLRTQGSSSLEKRGLREDPIALCSFLRRGLGEGGADLFSWESRTGCLGMVQSCASEGLNRTSGSITIQKGWSDPGTGFLVAQP